MRKLIDLVKIYETSKYITTQNINKSSPLRMITPEIEIPKDETKPVTLKGKYWIRFDSVVDDELNFKFKTNVGEVIVVKCNFKSLKNFPKEIRHLSLLSCKTIESFKNVELISDTLLFGGSEINRFKDVPRIIKKICLFDDCKINNIEWIKDTEFESITFFATIQNVQKDFDFYTYEGFKKFYDEHFKDGVFRR